MIRLLNVESFTLQQFKDEECPPYVIISHRWAEDPSQEVVYDDMAQPPKLRSSRLKSKPASASKITQACQKVLEHTNGEITHLWLDTVCIKQDNPMELSTAINSMYRLYEEAKVCFAYLSDFPSTEVQTLGQSDWFNRGWTLQELIAPREVQFFDRDWRLLGDKWDLRKELTSRTNIDKKYLIDSMFKNFASVSKRMSWMVGRRTTVPEDTAYCLLGIFDVNMPLLYGEGKKRAFRRLQEEIMKHSDDQTLFVWRSEDLASEVCTGLLAPTPDWFRTTGNYRRSFRSYSLCNEPYHMTNKGVAIYVRLHDVPIDRMDEFIGKIVGTHVGALACEDDRGRGMGVHLQHLVGDQYRRVKTNEILDLSEIEGVTDADLEYLQRIYVC
ncbi:MAG: hypothetical protein Q9178_007917 [Gyalolechia marmorata]